MCPLWVISGHTDKSAPRPLYPNNEVGWAHPIQHLLIGIRRGAKQAALALPVVADSGGSRKVPYGLI